MKKIPDDEIWSEPPENSILGELIEESKKLLANSHTGYPHRAGIGDHRENLLRDFLRSRLPRSIDLCKGHIQDSHGRLTSEFDILIYDPDYRMVIAKADAEKLVLPVESVIAVVEVRTHIDSSAITTVAQKLSELAQLTRYYQHYGRGFGVGPPPGTHDIGARQSGASNFIRPIPVHLLGFDSSSTTSAATEWERHEHRPDTMACLGQYVITRDDPDSEAILIDAPHTELAVVMLRLTAQLLHAKDRCALPDLLQYFRVPV